ncbi:hypothetical protein GYMLUDRAFT_254769 [Collybiopsis luxurians FD-317 M1]|nr:hypothetical protein GYMLUDRAFT_254769 [Collybiopsis luxurians FD-317 M1]
MAEHEMPSLCFPAPLSRTLTLILSTFPLLLAPSAPRLQPQFGTSLSFCTPWTSSLALDSPIGPSICPSITRIHSFCSINATGGTFQGLFIGIHSNILIGGPASIEGIYPYPKDWSPYDARYIGGSSSGLRLMYAIIPIHTRV